MNEVPLEAPPARPGRGQLEMVREAALKAIAAQPGISQGELVDRLAAETGAPEAAALDAIRSLDREGAVASRRTGRTKIYAEAGREAELKAAAVVGPARQAVIDAVASQPGIGQSTLAEQLRERHGLAVSSVVAAVRALEREGVIASRPGRRKAYVLPGAEPMADGIGSPGAAAGQPLDGGSAAPLEERIERGEAGALAWFYDARSPAVFGYCSHVAAPEAGASAVEAAFCNLFEAVRRGEAGGEIDLDGTLLRATRVAAADRAPTPPPPRPAGGRRGAGGREMEPARPSACELMPRLLAARASGILSRDDALRMDRHLQRCADCRAAEDRFNAAERAFGTLREGTPLPEVRESLLERFAVAAAYPASRQLEAPAGPAEAAGGHPSYAADPDFGPDVDAPVPGVTQAYPAGAQAQAHDFAEPAAGTPGSRAFGADTPPTTTSRPRGGFPLRGRGLVAAGLAAAGLLIGGAVLALTSGNDEPAVPGDAAEPGRQKEQRNRGSDAGARNRRRAGRAERAAGGVNPAAVRVSVLSGADIPLLAARTGKRLSAKGYKVEEVANAPQPSGTSSVLYAPGARRQAEAVGKELDITTLRPLDSANQAVAGEARVVVIAGADRG